jgi:hypothetical protein
MKLTFKEVETKSKRVEEGDFLILTSSQGNVAVRQLILKDDGNIMAIDTRCGDEGLTKPSIEHLIYEYKRMYKFVQVAKLEEIEMSFGELYEV